MDEMVVLEKFTVTFVWLSECKQKNVNDTQPALACVAGVQRRGPLLLPLALLIFPSPFPLNACHAS